MSLREEFKSIQVEIPKPSLPFGASWALPFLVEDHNTCLPSRDHRRADLDVSGQFSGRTSFDPMAFTTSVCPSWQTSLFVFLNWSIIALRASQVALVVKNPPANAGDVRDMGSIPGLGRFPGGGHGNPFQYSCLENPHGQRSLVGYSPWGCKESNTTEATEHTYNCFTM